MMTNKEKEHYENLARYYNSKKEPCETEMMKFKCVVEYEYPCDHKPPVKADIYLHGDMVSTSEIKPLQTELEKIKAGLEEIRDRITDYKEECFGMNVAIEYIENCIKGE